MTPEHSRRLGFVALGFVLAAAAWMFAYQIFLGRGNANTHWVAALYEEKHAIASSFAGPRIIVAGGSSGLFDIRADMLTAALGMPVINYATHAGLLTETLLNRLRPELRKGDIVLLCLEYPLYGRGPRRSSSELLDNAIRYLESIPPLLQWEEAWQAPWEAVLVPWSKDPLTGPAWFNLYKAPHLDAYGDTLGNNEVLASGAQELRLAGLGPIDFDLTDENVSLIKSFIAWCRARGITVWATSPALLWHPKYAEPQYARRFEQIPALYKSLDVPLWVRPREAFYPVSDFLDTQYHLLLSAAERNTRVLIKALEARQVCDAPEPKQCESPICQLATHFRGWIRKRGLGPFEGPYPQYQLGPVVWMLGSDLLVRVAEHSSRYRLWAEFRATRRGQEIEVWADDRLLRRFVADSDSEFASIELAIEGPIRTLRIRTRGAGADYHRRSVLFRSLKLSAVHPCV
jgi:hypothetical protein